MKKQFLSMILSVCMIASVIIAMPVMAEETEGDFTFIVSDGKAMITGFNKEYSGVVNIPSTLKNYPVTAILDNAFRECNKITNVVIAEGITNIGTSAFSACEELTEITIPNTVEAIGDSAFSSCKKLSALTVPNSVKKIGSYAFSLCLELKSVVFHDGLNEIGRSAFETCKNLKNIRIPNSVTFIDTSAFSYCGLTDVVLSSNMTKISPYTFAYCEELINITIPKSIIKIEGSAFRESYNIENVYYEGTEADWENIEIDDSGNQWLTFGEIHYNSSMPEPEVVASPAVTPEQQTNSDITKQLVLFVGKTNSIVFGDQKENDVAPIVRNDRTMLPARFVAENLGATVEWDQANQQVKIIKGDKIITLTIGSDVAYVNGVEQKLDSPAFVENDRTYTPVRFIAENLDADVQWNGDDQSVTITKQ